MLSKPLDLSVRADPDTLLEWMDDPWPYEEMRACHRDLSQLNALTLASRPTLRWLEEIRRTHPTARPLRILDVGSGGGDMLRRIERWAQRRKIAVELTGIDLNPHTERIAREFTGQHSAIRWLTGDATAYSEPVDVVINSLLMHHLSEPAIVRLLQWMEETAQRGWFISDLVREASAYRLFDLLTSIVRWHRFVRHDGLVSFRRSFREEDWERIIAAAGIDPASVKLERWRPAKLCVGRIK